jgi:hypothetical protein
MLSLGRAVGFMPLASELSKKFTPRRAGMKKAPVNTGALTLLNSSK